MIFICAAAWFALAMPARAADPASLGIGRVATPAEIAGWDIDVRADGRGLPPGHGSVREGGILYSFENNQIGRNSIDGTPLTAYPGGPLN